MRIEKGRLWLGNGTKKGISSIAYSKSFFKGHSLWLGTKKKGSAATLYNPTASLAPQADAVAFQKQTRLCSPMQCFTRMKHCFWTEKGQKSGLSGGSSIFCHHTVPRCSEVLTLYYVSFLCAWCAVAWVVLVQVALHDWNRLDSWYFGNFGQLDIWARSETWPKIVLLIFFSSTR